MGRCFNQHHRRSIRLPNYDYSNAGFYFVTVCTKNRECLFGDVVDGKMELNDPGRMVQLVWDELPNRFPTVQLDEFTIMPNHVHGVISIVGAQFIAPTRVGAKTTMGAINRAPTLGKIVRAFKAVSTRRIRLSGTSWFGWQRNYYEHVIRNGFELDGIRQYVQNNPTQWAMDENNPQNIKNSV